MRYDARSVTAKLGGHWYSDYGVAACPICQKENREDQNALTLSDGDSGHLLAHCKKSGCAYPAICAALAFMGVDGGGHPPDAEERAQRAADRRAAEIRRSSAAYSLWDSAQPISGGPAERYLREVRGISAPHPVSLRYHPLSRHPGGQHFPAIVALVQGVALFAVHRTFLRPDGLGKAEVEPCKAMLGSCKGGAVELAAAPTGPLVVCEGIETGSSLASGLVPEPATIWAALSTSGVKGLVLPKTPHRLIVATDGDEPGRLAGKDLAQRASALGWRVELLEAPAGTDWNDYLRERRQA